MLHLKRLHILYVLGFVILRLSEGRNNDTEQRLSALIDRNQALEQQIQTLQMQITQSPVRKRTLTAISDVLLRKKTTTPVKSALSSM